MARYRKVDPRIWNDAKFSSLGDRAKFVFLMILTHPHLTSLGAMRATIPGLAAELGWSVEAFGEAFREVTEKGLVEHDEKASFVGLPKYLKYNGPESPNVVKSWENAVDLIPECELKHQLFQRVKAFVEGKSKGFGEALPEAFRKSSGNLKQEQKQKTKPDLANEKDKDESPVLIDLSSWKPKIAEREFENLNNGLKHFNGAMGAGVLAHEDRFFFLCLWKSVNRRYHERLETDPIDTRIGYFRKSLERRWKNKISNDDETAVEEFLREADRKKTRTNGSTSNLLKETAGKLTKTPSGNGGDDD
ncbi:MAG: hypothetical protein KDA80_07165 [Planctomycetaceae bacterium]|nr:hypothetical protein [Planctomycetaceae bacterium]